MLNHFSRVQLFVTLWILGAHQALLSMGFSRQEHWGGLPCPPPGDLPHPGIESASLMSPALAAGFYRWHYLGSPFSSGGEGKAPPLCPLTHSKEWVPSWQMLEVVEMVESVASMRALVKCPKHGLPETPGTAPWDTAALVTYCFGLSTQGLRLI